MECIREKMPIRNAAVFPVPVCAWAATSPPRNISGSVSSCPGGHSVKFAALIPLRTGSGICSSSNLTSNTITYIAPNYKGAMSAVSGSEICSQGFKVEQRH